MLLPLQVTELMGQKVNYCRARPGEDGKPELFKGQGIITGIIIGATKRIQILVQDKLESADKAYTLDLLCINPTDADAEAYFEHHKRIRAIVDEHNKNQKEREAEKIKEVDVMNAAMFGAPLEL